jgi:hypothetical protein
MQCRAKAVTAVVLPFVRHVWRVAGVWWVKAQTRFFFL